MISSNSSLRPSELSAQPVIEDYGQRDYAHPFPGPSNYESEGLSDVFRDFDDRAIYDEAVDAAFAASASNFVIQFGDNKAEIACNLHENQVVQLLGKPRPLTTPVRWINIWNPSTQRGLIEAIGRRYHFSRRLTTSIWAWDGVKDKLQESKHAGHGHPHKLHHERPGSRITHRPSTSNRSVADLEAAIVASSARASGIDVEGKLGPSVFASPGFEDDARPAAMADNTRASGDLAVFKMMQGILNYTTIDQERLFVCIGANWLHKPPKGQTKRLTSLVPPKHWSWFILCEDHTVISFHEAAHYSKAPKSEDKATWEREELKSIRSNTLKVFCQLSVCGLGEGHNEFAQLTSVRQPGRFRPPGGIEPEGLEGSSNLFYYLFEDYSAAIDILIGSKMALDGISKKILQTADWKSKEDTTDVIPMLYELNKELRQLYHLFSNYKILIDQLLNTNSVYPTMEEEWDGESSNANIGNDNPRKTLLSVKAANRFRRLQIQLQSLMLDAIQDCRDETASLQGTYFSLITQKDSHSTERLTRSATLLAKLSVFFLPISFMTSYFSVQIPGLVDGYTAGTYWGAFGVIASVSFLSLFFFSKVLMFLSERLDHWADGATRWASDKVGIRRRKARRAYNYDEA
ncbi:hypothetical protein SEUCBS139899_006059 [Sporothrix eucalyptigena]|uniref:ADP-ribosylation factor n=1 Tax=Sporothrix eucalyptigena TaxID=1812306 RepID=A0ABP0CPA7_9PEZI